MLRYLACLTAFVAAANTNARADDIPSVAAYYKVQVITSDASLPTPKRAGAITRIKETCTGWEGTFEQMLEFSVSNVPNTTLKITETYSFTEKKDGSHYRQKHELTTDRMGEGVFSKMTVVATTTTEITTPHEVKTIFLPMREARLMRDAARRRETEISYIGISALGQHVQRRVFIGNRLDPDAGAAQLLRRPGWTMRITEKSLKGDSHEASMTVLDNGVATEMVTNAAGYNVKLQLTDIKELPKPVCY